MRFNWNVFSLDFAHKLHFPYNIWLYIYKVLSWLSYPLRSQPNISILILIFKNIFKYNGNNNIRVYSL